MVIKRDKRKVPYSADKIRAAIKAAMCEVGEISDSDLAIVEWIVEHASAKFANIDISVEEIQDFVERKLMESSRKDVAKAYILYREKRSLLREDTALASDRISYMDEYIHSSENAATSSETDANANIGVKNVANLDGEVYKSMNRQIQRYRMTKKLKELYPEVASQYVKDLNHHIIYAHDEASCPTVKNYCEAVSLYPLLVEGTKSMDGLKTTAPHHLHSLSGQLANLDFLLAAQCRGAVAFGEFFNVFEYYCVKDFGPNFHEIAYRIESSVRPPMMIIDSIHQAFQEIVYMWNQPAGNRSYQSPFTNISYYDEGYWHALFDDFRFPDGTKPKWERVSWLQKEFMKWFSEERKKTLLTFPVETMALLSDGKDIIDKEYKEFTAQMYAEGHSFFTYISDNPNALASCCFSKDTKFLWKSSTAGVHLSTFEDFYKMKYDGNKENFKIFHNGSWVEGKMIKLPNRKMYKVVTENNKEFVMTDNHINVTLDGEKITAQLSTDDYLMFNTQVLSAVPERDEHLTFEQGVLVGAFLGDGSFGTRFDNGVIYETNYSLNSKKFERLEGIFQKALEQMGLGCKIHTYAVTDGCLPVGVYSKELVSFLQRWTSWVEGTKAYTKKLNLDCLLQSPEFRKGILQGWYETDGGNSNRCYSTSKELIDGMEVLITSLGMSSFIDVDDRDPEHVEIRGIEYNRHGPLYCLRFYDETNHRVARNVVHSWIKRNNSIYFKIKSIEEVEYTDEVYCIECANKEEPYFTLPSGLITHNCRLRNQVQDNVFSFTTGLTGVQTGSANVITLNLARITQDAFKKYQLQSILINDKALFFDYFKQYLVDILERVYKYQIAFKTLLYEVEDAGMLTASNAGYISMQKLYLTVGVNGLNEAAEFLGMKCSFNDDYKAFCQLIFGTISEQNRLHSTKRFMFNTELVPAEGLSSKNYNWDKADGYWVPSDRVLYNSYIYKASDKALSIIDRLKMHGREFTGLLDGGVGCHINLAEHLSKGQYLRLLDTAIHYGTSYFTFNGPQIQCDDCGFITRQNIDKCPHCGSEHLTHWTRVIGFLRPTTSFDKYRQQEEKTRVYHKDDSIE